MADLFALTDLPSWLQVPSVDTETATRVRRVVSGWLSNATRLSPWPPDPVGDDIFAWAVELAGIAYRNPDAAASESLDDHNVSWEHRLRRKEILDAARAAYSTAMSPSFSFPDPDWHWVAVPLVSPLVQ